MRTAVSAGRARAEPVQLCILDDGVQQLGLQAPVGVGAVLDALDGHEATSLIDAVEHAKRAATR